MKRLILLIPALLAAAIITACGSGGSSGTPSSTAATTTTGSHNAVDVTFAQAMIPHHRQAIEMAELAPSRVQNPQVRSLAQQIRAAQTQEIATMAGWLTSWGQPTDPPADAGVSGHGSGGHGSGGHGSGGHGSGSGGMTDDGMADHGTETAAPDDSMEGMMSSADMTALRNATGPSFDEMFLAMMIEHHQGAITMAKTEIRDGLHTSAKRLAENIRRTQTAEITSMQDLLTKI
ncbi:DUF305 domain-containing protein [Frankia sp. QA3]|uniref:DUF305 domain-containing protein n=1 Tax=Frankia sp. QA3 TaxID=710111 RepID=UPI000269C424|nr:DUF305 domain-containing protein [Frankia sp. QA3]EIV94308.1 hypothetical protein FraQA3DRAFT_4053 [Frankia sp. QA3]